MLEIQFNSFMEYRDHINKIGNDMPGVFKKLSENIHSTQKYRFLLTITMVTELIKVKLRGLIILDDYINEMRLYLDYEGKYEIRKMKECLSKTYGQTLKEFFDRYNLEMNNNNLYLELIRLNKVRNDAIHNGIMKYGGDIQKIDDEIRPYILTQTINNLQRELTTLVNIRRDVLAKIESQIRQKKLI